jgi:glucose/arabinose dehydrogenase/mono/diheme cytochrome c family protein
MPLYRSQNSLWSGIAAALCSVVTLLAPIPSRAADAAAKSQQPCPNDDTGLTLPQGFCATIFADGIGHARHLVAAANGVVYVNTWSGRYYGNDTPHAGGFLVALQDTTGSGKADINQRFGDTAQSGAAGGTGIGIYNGALYAELNDKILKFPLSKSSVVPGDKPQTVVSGLPLGGDHPMHPFAIDAHGGLYIDVASATNSCQEKNRTLKSKGMDPCTELETRGGIWRYEANKTDQLFSAAQRYATGIRNAEGFGLDTAGRIFVTQHGRDQLHTNWPDIIKEVDQEATLPAEVLLLLKKDGDYGWPFCYYDPFQQSLVLAPEYGGDGKNVGACAKKSAPVAVFPAHWAPNDMVLYEQQQFPARYRKGVFIAFHGSWNRAPYSQGGYNIVYQGLSGDKASGQCEIFADGFAGADKSPAKAAHRPTGLAVAPDGALYVADDVAGRIYRIVYRGSPGTDSATVPVPCPSPTEPAGPIAAARAVPPEGTHPDAGSDTGALKPPPGATPAMVALGARVYRGQVGGAPCTGCHGANGGGSTLGPDLTGGKWLWSNGSYQGIASTIAEGVAQPKQFRAPMPAMGGAQLSSDQLFAVAAYVWALSHH